MQQKLILTLLVALFFISFNGVGQQKKIKAYLNERQFYAPSMGNYLEVQLHFAGHTLAYVTEKGDTYAEIEVSHIFSQNDTVVQFDKYVLKGPLVLDSIVEDFHDIQRYSLPAGTYQYELLVNDKNAEREPISAEKEIVISEMDGRVAVSNLSAAESIRPSGDKTSPFTKMGYNVIPMVTNYYPSELQFLPYYVEIYNTDRFYEDSVYVIKQQLVSREGEKDLSRFTRYFRYETSSIQPVAKYIDISTLPTGAYTLELSVINRDKDTIVQEKFDFDRNNSLEMNSIAYESSIVDPAFEESIPTDSTGYYVASLIPISNPSEVKNIIDLLKQRDNEKNKKYLQAYWKATSPENSYEAWMQYRAQVRKVERLFATNFQVGFETDRGRVYLQYGAPNQLTERPSSPSEYPYEIWQYDKIGRFSNKRFVFYSPTNLQRDYRLLHSDMVGELQNYRWRYALNKRNTPDQNLDNPNGSGYQPHFGGNSSLYYNSF